MCEGSKNSSLTTSTALLQSAIHKLEHFALLHEKQSNSSSHAIDVLDGTLAIETHSPLEKTIELAGMFIPTAVSQKGLQQQAERKKRMQEELQFAVRVMKTHYSLIEQLQEGTPEEQQVALSALEAIQRYNQAIENAHTHSVTWSHQLAQRIFQTFGFITDPEIPKEQIPLPCIAIKTVNMERIQGTFHSKLPTSSKKEEFNGSTLPVTILSTQEADLFRMKVRSLLKEKNFPTSSIDDALRESHKKPVHLRVEQTALDRAPQLAIAQTLSPFPGEEIVIEGAFSRDAKSNRSIPVRGSFKVTTHSSKQNGFPHPLQLAGWALPEALIPPYPTPLDTLCAQIPELLESRRRLAQELLPGGALLERAKQLLESKRHYFNQHAPELLPLHRELCLKLTDRSEIESIDSFFDTLPKKQDPYRLLGQTMHMVNEIAANQPYKALQKAWLYNENFKLLSREPRIRLITAGEILAKARFDEEQKINAQPPETAAFIKTLVRRLGDPCARIILYHFSETLSVEPPPLDYNASKLLRIAIAHMKSFIEELENENLEECDFPNLLKSQLHRDLELLSLD